MLQKQLPDSLTLLIRKIRPVLHIPCYRYDYHFLLHQAHLKKHRLLSKRLPLPQSSSFSEAGPSYRSIAMEITATFSFLKLFLRSRLLLHIKID
ncbi:hypothetical protein DUNSADRAFT_16264 [Dunaliella salina]|uniref:Encoded protein n=1 Tax=Dunaliella salina TaxID=3046 RepID=A0ABQ7G409_DUNSA|nr:hypothetical protein DUNSADRAFT_16264 [Dunaliella salina]|eukprot:KAF5829322.1 hypothetical protein DUNSADRAFT_16264 [Dunaliella salina]